MTVYEARRLLADKALTFVGTQEGSIVHQWIINQYNEIRPLPRSFPMTTKLPWCATFVSVCAKMAGMLDIIPAECGCPEMVKKFQDAGRWEEYDRYHPAIGDICFYDWGHDTADKDNRGTPAHVGIVTAVYNNSFVLTEGNRSDAVCNITLQIGDGNIRGFGLPDFTKWTIEHYYEGGEEMPPDYKNEDPNKWAAEAWEWAKAEKICDGSRPRYYTTREEVVTMLHRFYLFMEGKNK